MWHGLLTGDEYVGILNSKINSEYDFITIIASTYIIRFDIFTSDKGEIIPALIL